MDSYIQIKFKCRMCPEPCYLLVPKGALEPKLCPYNISNNSEWKTNLEQERLN